MLMMKKSKQYRQLESKTSQSCSRLPTRTLPLEMVQLNFGTREGNSLSVWHKPDSL